MYIDKVYLDLQNSMNIVSVCSNLRTPLTVT